MRSLLGGRLMQRRLFWLILVGIVLTVFISFPALAQYNPYRTNPGFADQAMYNPYATRLPSFDEIFGRFALDFIAAVLGFIVGAFLARCSGPSGEFYSSPPSLPYCFTLGSAMRPSPTG